MVYSYGNCSTFLLRPEAIAQFFLLSTELARTTLCSLQSVIKSRKCTTSKEKTAPTEWKRFFYEVQNISNGFPSGLLLHHRLQVRVFPTLLQTQLNE